MAKKTKEKEVKVQSMDEYLGVRGLASPMSDYMPDKTRLPHGETARQRKAREKAAAKARNEYSQHRNAAITSYNAAVAKGEVRPPTVIEKALRTAHGHEDNERVQAARRVLEKRGIDWRTGKPLKEKQEKWSMPKLIKNPKKEGKYLAHGDDGKIYEAEKVNKYMPGGVMFFCIPAHVKILGYSRPTTTKEKQITKPATKANTTTSRSKQTTRSAAKTKKKLGKK